MVGMDHDHDVAAHLGHRSLIAGLLIPAVAAVALVHDHADRQRPGQLHGAIARTVVDEQDLVDPVLGDVVEGRLERLFRVVGGKDGDHFLLAVRHQGGEGNTR